MGHKESNQTNKQKLIILIITPFLTLIMSECHEALIFLFLKQNICCGYFKELFLSDWNGSFEHPKHMFKFMLKTFVYIDL